MVTLLGLVAGATVWSLADDARRSAKTSVVRRIVHADRMARLAGEELGSACVLRFDLDRQRMWRVTQGGEHREAASHAIAIPSGHRIERIVVWTPEATATPSSDAAGGIGVGSGMVDIAYSNRGRSSSYAIRVGRETSAGHDAGDNSADDSRTWLVFAGLTGQAIEVHDEDEIKSLHARFTATRLDAP